jgi:hypothetical protein
VVLSLLLLLIIDLGLPLLLTPDLLLLTNIKTAMENQDKHSDPPESKGKKAGIKEFFSLGEVAGYFFRKKKADRPANINITIMHGINKIAIIVFLLGVIYLILKRLL